MASVTAVAFTTKAFPTWFAWASGALLTGIVVVSALGAAGMAAGAGFLGLLVVAASLTFRQTGASGSLTWPEPYEPGGV